MLSSIVALMLSASPVLPNSQITPTKSKAEVSISARRLEFKKEMEEAANISGNAAVLKIYFLKEATLANDSAVVIFALNGDINAFVFFFDEKTGEWDVAPATYGD
jgi:hypothetical protein